MLPSTDVNYTELLGEGRILPPPSSEESVWIIDTSKWQRRPQVAVPIVDQFSQSGVSRHLEHWSPPATPFPGAEEASPLSGALRLRQKLDCLDRLLSHPADVGAHSQRAR